MSQQTFLDTPFLDHRIVRPDDKSYIFDTPELITAGKDVTAGVSHYVFHNAFCCSTLFSRCLNAYQPALVLREPNVLFELASIQRYAGTQLMPDIDTNYTESQFNLVTNLLTRKFEENDSVIIKPTDGCNNIIGKLLDVNIGNKCLLMYSDIERFLTAIFKNSGRASFMKVRANELSLDEMKRTGQFRVHPEQIEAHQRAALVWVLHMENFRNIIKLYGKDRVQTLDSEVFLADQAGSVTEYLKFIGINANKNSLEAIISTKTQKHSKTGNVEYGHEQREQEFQIQRENFSKDIDAAIEWARSIFGDELIGELNTPT